MANVIETLLGFVSAYGGYLGVFSISLVSNSIPFVGVPYLAVVAGYIARESLKFGLPVEIALILTSALGSTLGKLVVYSIAAGFRLKLNESTKENLRYFVKYSGGVVFPLIILFAATPVPDDMLYVPLGLAKYPLLYFFLGVFVGKAIMLWIVSTYFRIVYAYLGEELIQNPALVVCVIVATTYLMMSIVKMDWKAIAKECAEKGLPASFRLILMEFIRTSSIMLRKVYFTILSILRKSMKGAID